MATIEEKLPQESIPKVSTKQAAEKSGTQGGRYFVKTYGCQMNVYDSERIEDVLANEGYTKTDQVEEADLVLLNTCHIREKAAEKVYSHLGRIRKLKEKRAKIGKEMLIGVTGCVAQAEGGEIIKRAPTVDLVAGPQTYHNLAEMIGQAKSGKKVIATEFEIEEKFSQLPAASRQQTIARGVAAYLTIQEGCDKFCTFCVVPYTRGAEVSRSTDQILNEAQRLVDAGVREITLLGQNVNAWHGSSNGASINLGDLLHLLAQIEGIDRLRYTTSHPIDMTRNLIDAHREIPKLMPYLHLPVQAGADRILQAMNRHHTCAEYIEIIDQVRQARSDIAISGDFIVGFPGETDEEFEATMEVVRRVEYASAFSFKYSPRPGTPGADIKQQVPDAIKSERLVRLQELLRSQQTAFNQGCVGKQMDLLLEKQGRTTDQLIGRSPWLQSVVVDGHPGEIGTTVQVEVTQGGPASLQAKRIPA